MSTPVPVSRVPSPQSLRITTKVSGELMQDSNTSQMIFSIPRLIAELSCGTTLLAGTVILTGTPAGVGAARTPPRFLRDGDVVEITIDGLGTLRNPVRHE
jgi:2-keto-4-pentenoate hydratase/2-oxohepta-3-ene-1,7-dioic acid hydratase in catechol pathway